MSELKVRRHIDEDTGIVFSFYGKSEADKVIADLEESHKKEVGQLLILNREQANAANRLRDNMEQTLRRQKKKRCLAMAEACMHKRWRPDEGFDYARSTRHMKKWLELAEKFKDGK